MKHVQVNGVELEYMDEGTGVPVVFSHGGSSDLRYWEPQRQVFAARYRFVAYSHRFHGHGSWPAEEGDYSADAHTADLVAVIRRLESGPVHLVGFSTAIGLRATLREPGLVRSLTIVEPNVPWLLEGDPEGEAVLAWWRDENDRVRAEAAGDSERGAGLWFELVNNRGPETFESQPEALRRMWLDNFNRTATRSPVAGAADLRATRCDHRAHARRGRRARHAVLAANRRQACCVYPRQPPRRHPVGDALHELPGARRLQRRRAGLPLATLSWTHAA